MAGGSPTLVRGNLTGDPEGRDVNGKTVANFTVASTERKKVGDAWEDGETTFFRVSAWDRLGENVIASLHKGDAVLVWGTLGTRSYETKEHEKRTDITVAAEAVGPSLQFATASPQRAVTGGNRQQGGGRQAARAQQQPAEQQSWSAGGYDDETPF